MVDQYVGAYNDEEYRKKHKKYILQKRQCGCGTITAICNMSHHKKTKKHMNWELENETPTQQIQKIKDLLHEFDERIEEMREMLLTTHKRQKK